MTMKQILLLLIFLIYSILADAQNLVPNPGFEEFNVCPPNTSVNTLGIPRIKEYIKFWEDNDISSFGASSDFFHTCANIYNSNIGPANGNGHLGGYAYSSNNYREYIQAPLKIPLCKGRTYRVKLKLASSRGARRNVDRIGVYFSKGRFTPPNAQAVALNPQVETPTREFITNETRWREFTMTFTNTGGDEDHLSIGNFRTNANTNFVGSNASYSQAYIYVDDVSVEDITTAITISGGTITNAICGNPDGFITDISVSGGSGSYTYQWINSSGIVVSTDLNPSGLPVGAYELLIDDGTCGQLINKTFKIQDNCPEPCPTVNLAPNPGFEEIRRCPNQRSLNRNDLGRNVRDWYSPNDGLPTLYNQCAIGSAFMSGTPSPYPGQGFVGFYTYYYATEYGDDRKEYVQAQLTSPMVAGESYTVQFDVQLRFSQNYATDQMGVYFSNNAVTINGSDGELGVTPSLKTPTGTYFTDTENWQTVTFSSPYVAIGGEEYITIGKFENVANTTFQDLMPGQGSAEAFYFIDNVAVEPVSGSSGNVSAGADQTIDDTQTAQLQATSSSGTPVSYTWTPTSGLSNATITNPVFTPPSGAGTYTFTVETDFGGGCKSTDQVMITVTGGVCLENIDAGADQTIDDTQTAQLQATPSGGMPVSHAWTPTTGLNNPNIENPIFTPPSGSGTYTFKVEVDFGDGCTSSDEVIVTVNTAPIPCTGPNLVVNHSFENFSDCRSGINLGGECTSSQPDTFCFMDDWSNASEATPDWSSTCNGTNPPLTADSQTKPPQDGETFVGFIRQYTVSNGFQYGEYVTSRLASPLVAGQAYHVSFYASLSLSRPYATYVGAYFSTNPVSQANRNPIDVIPQIESSERIDQQTGWVLVQETFTAAGGEEYITLGSFGLDRTIPEPITIIPGTPGQKGSYYYLDNIKVAALNGGVIEAGIDQTINISQTAQLQATPSGGTPISYSWTPSIGLSHPTIANPIFTPSTGAGAYTFSVTADFGGGCSDTDQITIFVNDPSCPLLITTTNMQQNNPECGLTNGSITGITVTGNSGSETYSWTDTSGNELANTIDLTGVGPGNYVLTVAQGACTTTSGPYLLRENGAPVLDDTNINITNANCDQDNGSITGISITDATGNETYSWTNTSGTEVGTDIELFEIGPDSYMLHVIVEACSTTIGPFSVSEIDICEDPTIPSIRIATALTPNGDSSNDMFMIAGLENYPNNRLYIFNRWGNKVYEAANYKNNWYGTYQNRPLPVATYYYILELNDAAQQVFKGAITIIR